jgi:hypothetical protein
MGFFDFLKSEDKGNDGKFKSPTSIDDSYADNQAISTLATAYSKLEENLGLKSTGRCAILVKNMDIPEFKDMRQYVDSFLSVASDKQKIGWDFTYRSLIDNYGYLWFIIEGKEIQDMVVAINSIGDTIHEKGFSRQLLAAVFEFTTGYETNRRQTANSNIISNSKYRYATDRSNSTNKNQFLVYNYKIDKFYPFVPYHSSSSSSLPGDQPSNNKRNHDQELAIMAHVKDEIPFEKNMSLWYPIWNTPFG